MENTTTKVTEIETLISKDLRRGWKGKTVRTENGITFSISTFKSNGGIYSTAKEVTIKKDKGFLITTYNNLLDKPFLAVNHGKGRCTEKNVKDKHMMFLALFDEKINSDENISFVEKIYSPKIGDILFMDGYGKSKNSSENVHIIYNIENEKYYTVEKDSLLLRSISHVRDYRNKFGISMYFSQGYNMGAVGVNKNDLENLLIDAKLKEKEDAENLKKKIELEKIERLKKEEYLSNFKEADRRKTASLVKKYIKENFEGIEKVSVSTDVYLGGSSFDVFYTSAEKIEELEKWVKNLQKGTFNSMEDIYEFNNKGAFIIYDYILTKYTYANANYKTED